MVIKVQGTLFTIVEMPLLSWHVHVDFSDKALSRFGIKPSSGSHTKRMKHWIILLWRSFICLSPLWMEMGMWSMPKPCNVDGLLLYESRQCLARGQFILPACEWHISVLLVRPRDASLFFRYKNEETFVGRTYSSIDDKCGFTVNVVINGEFLMSFRIHKCLSLHDICTVLTVSIHSQLTACSYLCVVLREQTFIKWTGLKDMNKENLAHNLIRRNVYLGNKSSLKQDHVLFACTAK